jgi:5S rRNA maturation endonuclease (ribonuclease M5)
MSDSQGDNFSQVSPRERAHIPMMGHIPSSPNTSLESRTCDHDTTSDHGRTVDAQSARTDHRASPASDSVQQASTSFSHVGEDDPSVQPNPQGGMDAEDSNPVRKNDGDTESLVDCSIDDEYPEPSAAEMAAEKRRLSKRDYAIDKSTEWRKVPKDIRDRVKALVKKMESEWEHWATHDEDGDILSEDDRKTGSLSLPSDEYLLILAGLLQTYTDLQVLRAWNKYLLRTQGFGGVIYPIAVFIKRDFEILVEDKEKSSEEVYRHQAWKHPPLEAFVSGLRAESEGDGWIARCPYPKNHENGDSNLSLVINQDEDGKVLVHCRAGCNQRDVWNAAVEAAREVAVEDLKPIEAKKPKPKSEFNASPDSVLILHSRLTQVPEVQAWMEICGITSEIADKLQLGAYSAVGFTRDDSTKFSSPAVVTPHFDRAGKLVGLKARATSEKAFTQQVGSSIDGLFAVTHLNPDVDEVLVLEGDKDVATAMSHGFNATGILSAGSSVSDADIKVLATYKRIYLVGDQDKAGIAAMDRLAGRLPEDRVTRIRLSVKDIGELFEKHRLDFRAQLETVLHRQVVEEQASASS